MRSEASEQNDSIKAGQEVICDTRKQFERAGHKVPKIARELALIGYSDIADYITVDEGGALQVLPLDTLKKHKSRAIKKIREKTVITESKDGETLYKTSTVEFELHDKLHALNLVVEIVGIKKPLKVNHAGNVKVEVITGIPRVPTDPLKDEVNGS